MEKKFNIFCRRLREIIYKYGYSVPTQIQYKSFMPILNGNHVLIIAPTGSGKTEAAMFPIFEKLLKMDRSGIKVIYITPLRSLNRDIFRRIIAIASELNISIAIRHGDTPRRIREEISRHPPEILITTPESLQIILSGKNIRNHLKWVRWVILDEFHELISSKRGVQLSVALERLSRISKYRIQRIALSATIGDEKTSALFLGGIRNVIIIKDEEKKNFKIDIKLSSMEKDMAKKIIGVDVLLDLIKNENSILVFTNTRSLAEKIGKSLSLINEIKVYHSSLSREERIETEKRFRNGLIKALICTSSLELGVDIGRINRVVQYMSPRQAIKLLQRIGRSKHKIKETSFGTIISINIEDLIESIVIRRRALNMNLEKPTIFKKCLDVLAHQIVGLLLEGYRDIMDIYSIIVSAYPYSDLNLKELREVIIFLKRLRLIGFSDGKIYPRRKAYKYYFENISTIPDVKRFKVKDLVSGRIIGELDERFISLNYDSENMVFILSGKPWYVEKIDYEKEVINVSLSSSYLAAIPIWEGEMIPIYFNVAREIGGFKRLIEENIHNINILEKIRRRYNIDNNLFDKIIMYIKKEMEKGNPIPTDKNIIIESLGKINVIHIHGGSRVNTTLGLLLTSILSDMFSFKIGYRSDAYRIAILSEKNIDGRKIRDILKGIEKEDFIKMFDYLRKTKTYIWRFLHVAQRFGIIEKNKNLSSPDKIIKFLYKTPVDKETINEITTRDIDIDKTKKIIEMIKNGKLNIVIKYNSINNPSSFAEPILYSYKYIDYDVSTIPITLLINIVKARLFEEELKIICLHCGKWNKILKVKNIRDKMKCPICGSRILTLTYKWDNYSLDIIRKRLNGLRLMDDENKVYRRLQKNAKLYLYYGKRAAIVLAARGIGPSNALKIINRTLFSDDKDEIYRLIIEMERKYARTREYWREKKI